MSAERASLRGFMPNMPPEILAPIKRRNYSTLAKTSRNDAVIALLSAGAHTLEDLATFFGITRERVRQLAVARGLDLRNRGQVDPIRVLRVVRHPACHTWLDLAERSGQHVSTVHQTLRALGAHRAVERLFRWRKSVQKRARTAELVVVYQTASEHLGRPLTAKEILYLRPSPFSLLGRNYVAKLRRLAGEGVEPNSARFVQRYGSLRQTILRLAASPDGCTVEGVMRETGTTRASVGATIGLMLRQSLVYNADGKRGIHGTSTYRVPASLSSSSVETGNDND